MNKEELINLGFYLIYENGIPILMKNGSKVSVKSMGNGSYSTQFKVMVTGKKPMNYKHVIKLLEGE